jgi:ribonuclease G
MSKKILFTATPTEKRAALLENGRVVELVVERPDSVRLVGNIYRGKIVSILPGIQAAFVDIGLEKAAFLHASDVDPSLLLDKDDAHIEHYRQEQKHQRRKILRMPIEKVIEEGQQILVQVIKEPIGTKGAKVTTQVSLAGRFLVLVPDADFIGVSKKTDDDKKRQKLKKLIAQIKPRGVGFIVRTIGLRVSEVEFVKEIHSLLDKWRDAQEEALRGAGPKLVYHDLGITTGVIRDLFSEEVDEVYVDQQDDYNEIIAYLTTVSPDMCGRVIPYKDKAPLFDKYNIEKDLELSLKRKVWLKSGGYILFDHAEALLAIDVNTGRNVGRRNLEETIFKTNLEAAQEIARQFRLRDIGGLIVIDFIDMQKAESRKKIEEEMRRLLRLDPTVTDCTGLSEFGLMEITRKRVRPELQELYTDVCSVCNGLGWVFSPATVTARIDRWLNRADSKDIPRELRLAVNPAVASYLARDNNQMVKDLEREHHFHLSVAADDSLDQDDYEFYVAGGDKKPITSKFM